jgi:hypothetical protein
MTLLPPKLSRYRAVATLLLKYGRSSLVTDQDDLLATLTAEDDTEIDASDPAPDELASLVLLCQIDEFPREFASDHF